MPGSKNRKNDSKPNYHLSRSHCHDVIGDVGMVIAAFIIFDHLGTLSFLDVFAAAKSTFRPNDDTILLITMFLLVGAFAKSAQIPLHTWLADAMEGPTPVS